MAYVQGDQYQTLVRMEVAPATGSTTTIPQPYNWVVFTNPGTIAAQTVVLPSNPQDGDRVQISNTAIITSFTFSPAVTGFTNTGALSAGQGIEVAWSATLATPAWFVVAF